jgi:hypothetical protein
MRVYFAAAVCTWGLLTTASAPASAAEITDLASSFEKGKPFGFKLGARYQFDYKTASITRESLAYLQSPLARRDIAAHFGTADPTRTEIVPDLLYQQRRQSLSLDLAIGLFKELQLGISVPLILRDERQYNLDPRAGFNTCSPNDWSCVANSSSTFLDGIYPIQPADQLDSGSLIFRPPVRGGSGANLIDTINISLMGAPISQRRDPTKPTWVIGVEGQISVGTIMRYDNTRLYLDPSQPSQKTLIDESVRLDPGGKAGWNGVSEGLHRIVIKTALSHRFKYVDPYLGLYYMLPIERKDDGSPWKADMGFQQKRGAPQQKAGVTFGFEATPLENKAKGHRLALDFRGGLQFTFLGRGFSEAWELFSSSNALICDDQTALPPPFTYKDPLSSPGANGAVTQGTFNPSCRAPVMPPPQDTNPPAGYMGPRLNTAGPYYRQPYNGLTLIENYLTFNASVGIVAELFRHVRLRLQFNYQRDQGHVITQDDAGTKDYPDAGTRDTLNGKAPGFGCNPFRVDLSCPVDWNPAYRAVINQPGRRYRVDDVNMLSGSAMLQAYW